VFTTAVESFSSFRAYRHFSNDVPAQLIDSAGDPSKELWIAVDFDSDASLPRDFLLGNRQRSRSNFFNRPLKTTQTYRVFARAFGQGSVNQLVDSPANVLICWSYR